MTKSKNPAFLYYPKDWRADAVFTCSLAARGLWHEMLNMMHVSERYGYLSQRGCPIPDESIARYCGCTLQEYQTLLTELTRAGVPRRTSNGIIFSKRMVDDQKERGEWRKRKQNQRDRDELEDTERDVTGGVTQMSRRLAVAVAVPSLNPSSDPTSERVSEHASFLQKNERVTSQHFDIFYNQYPRQSQRTEAREAWNSMQLDSHLGEILGSVAAWQRSGTWDEERYIPIAKNFLLKRLWKESAPKRMSKHEQGRESTKAAIARVRSQIESN